jgi:hypothetical protein
LYYYNVIEENQEEDEDPINVQILETEGDFIVEGPQLEYIMYAKPLRMRKVNIGTKDKPKFVNIGDYWNDETIQKIIDLLCEYQDLFPTTFS